MTVFTPSNFQEVAKHPPLKRKAKVSHLTRGKTDGPPLTARRRRQCPVGLFWCVSGPDDDVGALEDIHGWRHVEGMRMVNVPGLRDSHDCQVASVVNI